MHILSVINYKGGVGKTVLSANVAAELAFSFGLKVLLVDLDPQASLTFACIPVEKWRELKQPVAPSRRGTGRLHRRRH